MKIIIPSYKRPGNVKTWETLGGKCIVAVHRFEAKEYRRFYPDLMILPDEIRGNIARVRNWILDHAKDDRIVMMDDDIREIGYFEGAEREQTALAPAEIIRLIHRGYVLAEDLGVTLWGINLQADPKFYRQHTPFSLKSPVLGPFSCHLRPKLRYEESLFLNEDYDFFLRTMMEVRRVLRMNKFYYRADHIMAKGGCSIYRTIDKEKAQAEAMIRRWGRKIVRYDFKRSTNPIVHVPIAGV